MEYMDEVLEKFRVNGWKYIYQLIIGYLLYLKEYLLMAEDAA